MPCGNATRALARKRWRRLLPNPAPIGGRVRIAISGFAPGRRLLVTVGSTPEFEVTPANGAFSWDQQLRPGTAAGVYRILVRDPAGNSVELAPPTIWGGGWRF